MKKIATLTLITSSLLLAKGDYEVKSAKIELEIKSTQNVGDRIKEETGTKRIVIDNYGEQEWEDISHVIKFTKDGKTKVKKFHYIKYINGGIRYAVDLNRKTMNRMTNHMGMLFGTKKYKGSVDNMLKLQKMKKIGTDTVAGHKCDVWQLGEMSKTCYYKGFPLRKETTFMGMKRVVVATKAEFDIEISKDDFKMPIFPMNGRLFSKSELEEMDKKHREEKKRNKIKDAKSIKILNEAYVKAGIDKGKAPTKEQIKIAEAYIQNAMFPIEKSSFLEDNKDIKKIKKCLEKADTIRDANYCNPNGDGYEEWNNKIKKETLEEISIFETKTLPCVENSKNAKEMEMCFPDDEDDE